ncbi:MAG: S9 family peptidase [Ilumatobacter sp.]|nr:S9 family peptidase [Ilumatobacter sp.]
MSAPDISVDLCIGGRDLTEPKLSPDGTTVAFVVRWGSMAAIATVAVDGGPERVVTVEPAPAPGRGLGGGCFEWLPDGSALVYAARDGNLWLQPVPGGSPRPITDVEEDRRHEAPAVSPDGSGVVSALDQAEIWWHPLGDGDRTVRRLDDGSADFVFDPHATSDGSAVAWVGWSVPDMPWDSARIESFELAIGTRTSTVGTGSIQQPRSMPDGRRLSVRDDTGWLNVWLDDAPLVEEPFEHAGPTWGMGQRSYAVSPAGDRVAFTRNEAGFGRLCVADVAAGEVDEIGRGVHGQLTWVGERLVALRTGARTPTEIVSYDTGSFERTSLVVGPLAGWDAVELPEPTLVEVDHHGVTLHARRYVAGRGRTICWVHGGPTDQWQVEFMPRIAFWWSRGWDVLAVDPRGTTGHGRAYQQALQGEWGRMDVDDTAAILRASHEVGDSTPSATVLMGSSSGGLTVLGLMAHHPSLAAGGVTLYPVADLAVLAEESHRFEAHYTISLVGPLDDVETYAERSPVGYADRIAGPLLVMHGDEDPVVPLSSTVALAERMRAAGGDVQLVVMEGEGHGFRDPANKRREYELTQSFVERIVAGTAG